MLAIQAAGRLTVLGSFKPLFFDTFGCVEMWGIVMLNAPFWVSQN